MSLKAFNEQKHNADRRGIPFLFSYQEWIAWWIDQLGPNWENMRGRCKGEYCMARLGDKGPYTKDNVKCIQHSENVTDAAVNNTIAFGEAAGHAVLTDEIAKTIFISNEKMQNLADYYRISIGTINDIRSQRTWKRVTQNLSRQDLRRQNRRS